ncbi:DUF4190 domain-containing protein [Microbacterium sp. Sa4CUA7]|uniref:DUF4190 domain-containing protein n=1 Tax=Microbacterium pullorum TaxID=2762236 RepID=A0ABR8RY90_9MICO|nr:DUF4190 domain-containing protein [Microbacterium pullorum]MBD7956203.1 DUF4190 domain-containing protein [Microbacterium pullorum]
MTAATAHAWDSVAAWTALHRTETTPHELAAIAAVHPDYAAQIAAHPQAYPALVDWAEQVGAARRATPDDPQPADVIDLVGGTRRASGAHPLAFSADAAAWRAAVAGVVSPAQPGAGAGQSGAGAAQSGGGPAQSDAGPGEPWWVGVDSAMPAASAPTSSPTGSVGAPRPGHRATFEPIGAQRAEAIAVGTAAAAPAAPAAPSAAPQVPERPALPQQSAAAAARAAGAAYAAASAAAGATAVQPAGPPSTRRDGESTAVDTRALLAFVFAFVLAPMGVVFGHLALRGIAATGAPGRGYAVAGLIVGYAMIATALVAAAVTALTLLG